MYLEKKIMQVTTRCDGVSSLLSNGLAGLLQMMDEAINHFFFRFDWYYSMVYTNKKLHVIDEEHIQWSAMRWGWGRR